MTDPSRVVSSFLMAEGKEEKEFRDIGGTPFKQDSIHITKDNALKFLKKMYPQTTITVESMPEGLAYYGKFSAGRRMLGNYSFERSELWYKIYPGTKQPWKQK